MATQIEAAIDYLSTATNEEIKALIADFSTEELQSLAQASADELHRRRMREHRRKWGGPTFNEVMERFGPDAPMSEVRRWYAEQEGGE